MPDAEKRSRADFVIPTGLGKRFSLQRIRHIITMLCDLPESGFAASLQHRPFVCVNLRMREIALDTETTGLEPGDGHRVVEIGCIELINHIPTGEIFHTYLNPERSMSHDAYAVHGLDDTFLGKQALFADIADAFLEFIGGSPLVIHNAAFDLKFINSELQRAARGPLEVAKVVDTLELARHKFPGSPAQPRRPVPSLWDRQ